MMAYERLQPFGEARADLRAAVAATAAANPSSLKKNIELLFPVDKRKKKMKRQSWRDMKETMIAVTKAMGGTINEVGK